MRTSLKHVPALSERAGVPVYLKLESEQPTGAFKLRGAWNFMRQLPPEVRDRGVITYSSGNHGQAVAFAARRVGARAVVVMPETVSAVKIEGVERWGGEVMFAGTTSEDRYVRAMELADEQGLTPVPPFDHPHIIAGQGTVGLEIVEELPGVAHVTVPVGGGGLIAGITTAVKALNPNVRITAVEPENAAALGAALAAGRPVRLAETSSIADGLLPLSVGTLTFEHVKGHVEAVTVADSAIAAATVWLHEEQGELVEPSGAATTAALWAGAFEPAGPTVLVVSGGNVDPSLIAGLADT